MAKNDQIILEKEGPRTGFSFGAKDALIQNGNQVSPKLSPKSQNGTNGKVEESFVPCTTKGPSKKLALREYLTLAILCYINLINYMDRFTLAGVLDDVKSHFVLSNQQVGLVQTVFTIFYMVFAPFFGYWGDRYSRKWNVAFGVALWSAATLMGSFVGDNFVLFVTTRALVGVGQASFSTLAPVIISDLLSKSARSRVLAVFYFVLPIGSGLGYIVGVTAASMGGNWAWSLRATPVLGIVSLLLVLFVMVDPPRGGSDRKNKEEHAHHIHIKPTSAIKDILYLLKNKSFMLSTAGYTMVAFVSGALAWFAPLYLSWGFELQDASSGDNLKVESKMKEVSFSFGIAMMLSGLVGVPLGSILSQKLKTISLRADPLICGIGLFISAPLLYSASVIVSGSDHHEMVTLTLIFFGMLFLNLSWSIVADILLYTVVPTRRAMGQGLQILISFAFGAALSPYLVGLLSDIIKTKLEQDNSRFFGGNPQNATEIEKLQLEFDSLDYSLYTAWAAEILGSIFFLMTVKYIVKDKERFDNAIKSGEDENSKEMEILTSEKNGETIKA